jgi:2-oxoglutarate dehydrogenase E2 component (dihydrolipoamide succinyltransferase)
MTNIVVPELGESVVEARIARWLKKEGDRVEVGEPVVELETEKIDLEVNAEKGGVIASINRQEGDDVKIGELLAVLDESAASPSAQASASAQATADKAGDRSAAKAPTDTAKQSAGGNGASAAAPAAIPAPSAADAQPSSEAPKATPTARRMAKDHDVKLETVQGSGAAGRVMKQDVQNVIAPPAAPAAPTPSVVAPTPSPNIAPKRPPTLAPTGPSRIAPGERVEKRVRMSKRRATIARRLVEAQQTAAMLTTFNEIDMTALMGLRERRKEAFKKQYGVSLGIASFFVKAGIAALRAFPELNAEIQGDEIVYRDFYDIGMAVGAEGGLVVPVLRDADRMSFAQIELAIRDFAARAGDGTLTLEDLKGGTFTITNGGVFGSLLSTPILNPPQVGILGLHKIQDRAVAVNGQVSVRPMMYVALTYDHRIVDGREAVQFLVRIKEFIEDPGHLLIES